MSSTKEKVSSSTSSPFLRLPFELRLIIYEHLLYPSERPVTSASTSVANLLTDFHTYYSEDTNSDVFTLSVRTIDPWLGSQGSRMWRRRSTYHVRTGPFLTSTTPTTYRVLLSPYTSHLRHTVPSLLLLNRQIHAEASRILYSTYRFSFHTAIEACVPFLSDLTPGARSCIRHLGFTKKALPYTKEWDRAEWTRLCEYITARPNPDADAIAVQLHSLHLNVIGGKPDIGWEDITPITTADFATMVRMKNEWGGNGAFGGVDLDWVEELMQIKGLRELNVRALVEHCPRPVSEKLAFWVAFSKSVVQGGFADWIRGGMVEVL